MRGLPHLHGVFWLSEEKLKTYKNENGDYKDEILPNLIDEFISVSTNTKDEDLNELVREVNTHKHSKSCQKGNAKKDDRYCRFSFPKLPSNYTLVARPLSEETLGKELYNKKRNDAKIILEKVKNRLLEMSKEELKTAKLEDILNHVGLSSEVYHNALKIAERGATIILQRSPNEIWVNNYNSQFMKAWTANMDIQFCTDSYAVITYITDYLTKGDAGLTKELKNALKEKKTLQQLRTIELFKNDIFQIQTGLYC